MLHDSKVIPGGVQGATEGCAESRETVHQGRHAARHANGIAHGAGGQAASVGGQAHHKDAPRHAGWQEPRGVGGPGLAKKHHVHFVRSRQVFEQRGRPQRAAPGERVRNFGRQKQGRRPGRRVRCHDRSLAERGV